MPETSIAILGVLADQVTEGVVVYDPAGVVRYANRAANQILASDNLVGTAGADHVHPEDVERAHAAFLELGTAPDNLVEIEQRVVTASGETRWIWARLWNQIGVDPVDGIVSCFFDITDRKTMEDRLLQSDRLGALGQAAGYIAHDLNNLLAVIMGQIDLIELDPSPDSLSTSLAHLRDATRRAARYSGRLLNMARHRPLALQGFDLGAAVERQMPDMRYLVPRRIDMRFELTEQDCTIYDDPNQIEHILMNLVVNARDSIPRHGAIDVSVGKVLVADLDPVNEPAASPGAYVTLTVGDSGIGMPEEIKARLFDRHFTTKEEGTGLGLTIVNEMVANAGGFITVDSAPGRGSTFVIHWPLHHGEMQGLRSQDGSLRFGSGTLVLLESDYSLLDFIDRSLTHLGYTVHSAGTRSEAMALVHDLGAELDLVIADVGIEPGETTVVEAIRSVVAHLPIIATANDGRADVAGTSRVLTKPFGIRRLSDAVADAIAPPAPDDSA